MTQRDERSHETIGPQSTAASSVRYMGATELAAYKVSWRASCRLRKQLSKMASKATPLQPNAAGPLPPPKRAGLCPIEVDDDSEAALDRASLDPATLRECKVSNIAARLLVARLFDLHPRLLQTIHLERGVVVLDVPDTDWIQKVGSMLPRIVFGRKPRLITLDEEYPGAGCDAVYFIEDTAVRKDKERYRRAALEALALPLPFIAISPVGASYLPDCLLKAATAHPTFPPLDATAIMRTIRIVTGQRCVDTIDTALVSKLDATTLIIAVRFGRSPDQCVAELKRQVALKDQTKQSREIALHDLHGLGEAQVWAESAITDIAAWKRGDIAWSAVSSAVALEGSPGTGKTQFAKSFAAEVGFNLIVASYAKWQSADQGHLGHTLRAMNKDLETARAQAPSVLFIDEIDSFPDRAKLTHSYRDYTIDVVNALLEQLDGLAGREGVIVIGASNDLSRCDPALLRAGRFETIARIDLPNLDELEAMLRVRLGDDLRSTSIHSLAELALGMTGADIESIVRNARRTARRDDRPLRIEDLRNALVPEDDRTPESRWRTCVHEAAHILVDVIHFGPDDLFATTTMTKGRGGRSVRTQIKKTAGTLENYRKRLEVILAGYVGEQVVLGTSSHGAGGSEISDLAYATRLAGDMVASLGLLGSLTYFGPCGSVQEFLRYGEVRAAVAKELRAAEQSCRALLASRRGALEAVAQQLSDNGRIDGRGVGLLLVELARQNAKTE